jgi:hypothetical protein
MNIGLVSSPHPPWIRLSRKMTTWATGDTGKAKSERFRTNDIFTEATILAMSRWPPVGPEIQILQIVPVVPCCVTYTQQHFIHIVDNFHDHNITHIGLKRIYKENFIMDVVSTHENLFLDVDTMWWIHRP